MTAVMTSRAFDIPAGSAPAVLHVVRHAVPMPGFLAPACPGCLETPVLYVLRLGTGTPALVPQLSALAAHISEVREASLACPPAPGWGTAGGRHRRLAGPAKYATVQWLAPSSSGLGRRPLKAVAPV